MAGKNGGARPGAGRPVGALARRTKEILEKVEAGGLMPIDVFLEDMRLFHRLGNEKFQIAKDCIIPDEQMAHFKSACELKAIARDAARDAAPYIHPRLASIQGNMTVRNVEAELAELE